ncbi:hypothetical protein BDQ12DRAFT_354040 [Crucibulum laeve]|uniref:Uncharacterized protein n=1 Tax=Crucibulum laeve TaxID=68775 RepID=A0A5C3ME68_9AGAR|nr:hypothetical protein BDQ12DRAFT_354040 [Crucibulum laeve]
MTHSTCRCAPKSLSQPQFSLFNSFLLRDIRKVIPICGIFCFLLHFGASFLRLAFALIGSFFYPSQQVVATSLYGPLGNLDVRFHVLKTSFNPLTAIISWIFCQLKNGIDYRAWIFFLSIANSS